MLPDATEQNRIFEYVKTCRRQLHAIPELSECEFETSEYIAKRLTELGLKFTKIHTGMYVDIDGESPGERIALRCDMDGLPIEEKTDSEFRAKKNMHACGHDGHMAIVLGTAKWLSEHKPRCGVRLIFQFGEEGDGGADKMIKAGVLDGVDEIYAFHLCPELEKGKLSSVCGAMFAGTAEFDVEVCGKASHCADREKGADAFVACKMFADECETTEKQRTDIRIHIGKAEIGSARNIVADKGRLFCTFRYFDVSSRDSVLSSLSAALTRIDARAGTQSRIAVKAVYPPLVNSAAALKRLKSVANVEDCEPRYTAEDFAFYTEKIDGCMAWLGIKDEKYCSPLHSDTFGFEESALMTGVQTMIKLVCDNDNGEDNVENI